MRPVLDVNVIISALLSPSGAPARVLSAWAEGEFELVLSPPVLGELERALAYPKLLERIDPEDASAVLEWLSESTRVVPDPHEPPPIHSPDPDDDYLLALAAEERAALVSDDKHLLALAGDLPIYTASGFLTLLEERRSD